jgi:NOL1/NOP2/fmu family ribosome biogenesis protein
MQNQGLLVANEIHPRRIWELAENLERCGVTHTAVLNETPTRLADHFGPFFDRVLLDAPCSGEGMFRRNEAARQEWSPDLVQHCAARQGSILEDAARLVRPGGVLAYSTCTFSPEENEGVVAGFLKRHPEFELEEAARFPGFTPGRGDWLADEAARDLPLQHATRLWPQRGAAEGHFLALLRMVGDAGQVVQDRRSRQRVAQIPVEARAAFRRFWAAALFTRPPEERLSIQGSYLYRLPQGLPGLAGLKVIHPGWWLGEVKKGRFEPAHALAMGLRDKEASRRVALPVEAAPAYLRGEPLSDSGEPGWVLVSVEANGEAFPLGWGKRVGEIVKNEYPKGLRWMG